MRSVREHQSGEGVGEEKSETNGQHSDAEEEGCDNVRPEVARGKKVWQRNHGLGGGEARVVCHKQATCMVFAIRQSSLAMQGEPLISICWYPVFKCPLPLPSAPCVCTHGRARDGLAAGAVGGPAAPGTGGLQATILRATGLPAG